MRTERLIYFYGLKRSGTHAVIHFIRRLFDPPRAFYNNQFIGHPLVNVHDRYEQLDGLQSECTMVLFEDADLRYSRGIEDVKDWQEVFGEVGRFEQYAIVRDFKNMAASRYAHPMLRDEFRTHWRRLIELYQVYVDSNIPRLIYNDFIRSARDRQRIAERIGRPFCGNRWHVMTAEGGGSSFGDSDASAADLENRWRRFEDDAFFTGVVNYARQAGLCE